MLYSYVSKTCLFQYVNTSAWWIIWGSMFTTAANQLEMVVNVCASHLQVLLQHGWLRRREAVLTSECIAQATFFPLFSLEHPSSIHAPYSLQWGRKRLGIRVCESLLKAIRIVCHNPEKKEEGETHIVVNLLALKGSDDADTPSLASSSSWTCSQFISKALHVS